MLAAFVPVAASAAPAFVQLNYGVPQTPVTTVNVSYTSAQAVGNLNVVAVGWSNTTSWVLSVTDTRGNTYVRAVGPTSQGTSRTQSIYYASNVAAAAAGQNTVTVTFNAAVSFPDVRIVEYSGIATTNPLDVAVGASGNSGTSSSGSLTTTNANDLLVGANNVATQTTAAGANYTQRVITSPNGSILEDRIVTTTGAYSATATQSSGPWVMQLVAFRAASGGGGDTTAPSAPTGLGATAASATQINLTWSASTDNVAVTGYRVERCQGAGCSSFVQVGTPTATTFSDTGLSASTSYSYRVRAADAAGNLGAYSTTATTATPAAPDTQAPTAPTGLGATAASTTQINLTWTASTDNVGVTAYRVERCQGAGCSGFAQVATPAGTTFNDSGLTASTSYSYRVRATDAAGNLGAYSSTATTTTQAAPDTQSPTAPTGLSAVAASATQINLAWTAATDNVAVTGYRVERCQGAGCSGFLQVGTPAATAFNDSGLASATSYSYRVRATDAAGNLGPYSTTASTTTNAVPLTIVPFSSPPAVVGSSVPYTVQATGNGTLTYRWAYGDGTPLESFTSSPARTHVYASPGRFDVTVTVRDSLGEETASITQAVHLPLTAQPPRADSSILYESASGSAQIWAVNPDADTVAVIAESTLTKTAEVAVGDQPVAAALGSDGRVWVVNKASASITRINPATRSVQDTIALPRGSEPHGLVFPSGGTDGYVVLEALGQVLRLSGTNGATLATASVGSRPRHLSVDAAGTRLYVSRFVTPPLPGEATGAPTPTSGAAVLVLNASTLQTLSTILLPFSNAAPTLTSGPGLPNYLGAAVLSPDGATAWVPSKQDDVLRGTLRSGQALVHDHTVRAIASRVALGAGTQNARVDIDNASVPSAAAFDAWGNYLFVAIEGGRQMSVLDAYGAGEVYRFTVGRAPRGVAVSTSGRRVFVQNFMDRTVTVHDVTDLIDKGARTETRLATISTVAAETLPANVLLGKQLFYDAADPRLSSELYLSCAACHNDGGHDGRTWDFTAAGEGVRNTAALVGHAGMSQGPLHWSGNFDEVQDFEGQIRALAGGTGLMTTAQFNTGTRSQPLDDPKAGVSTDLDALAAYVTSLSTTPVSPHRTSAGALTASAVAGRAVFAANDCGNCHRGTFFTDSALGVRHDIGTLTSASGSRLGAPLDGIDTPTLRGLWSSAPYLHDGSQATLAGAVTAHQGVSLSSGDLTSLVDYLLQIDATEPAPSVNPSTPSGVVATATSVSQINLGWNASTDNVAVTGYRVERCQGTGCSSFVEIAQPTATTFNDGGLAASTPYSYRVRAIDGPGNLSGYSTVATATTLAPQDSQAPTAPTGVGATPVSTTQINLAWTASTDNVGVTGYRVERCQGAGCVNFAQIATPTAASFSDTTLAATTTYTYRVRATDAAGNLGAYSSTATATTLAATAGLGFVQHNYATPQTPQSTVGVTYTAAQTAGNLNVVAVAWFNTTSTVTSVTDTRGNVYTRAVGPTTQAQAGSQSMYYSAGIASSAAGTNIVTVTFSGAVPFPDIRIAEYRGIATASPLDGAVGGSGTGTTSSSGNVTTTNANDLLVAANYVTSVTTAPGSGYTQRVITSPDGSILEDRIVSTAGTYNATATLNSGSWVMQLVAFRGGAGGGGGDTQAPTAPTGLTPTVMSSTQINLAWTASTDNVGVTSYRVERCQGAGCSSFVQIATPSTTSFSDTGLTPATTYVYRVLAADGAGNLSGYAGPVTSTTQTAADTQAPTPPTGLGGSAASATQINLAWTASTDNVGVTGYRVERCQGAGCSNFAQIATPTAAAFNDTALAPATSYVYRVRAADAAGNLSTYAGPVTLATLADTQAPTAPGSLGATAVSTSQINLSWTASTDNVAVTGYRVERCQGVGCSTFTQVATPTATSYSDTGLAAATSYSYRVRAADGSGNLGPYSSVATTSTQSSPPVPIAFVQQNYAVPQTPQSIVNVVFNGAQTNGNLNVVAIGWSNATSQIVSVTDTVGNVYTRAVGPTLSAGDSQSIYYASGIGAAAAGANTVRVTFNTTVPFPDVRIAEYAGISTTSPLDGATGQSGSGTTSNSGNVTTVNANDLLVGANYVATVSTGPGAGFTQRVITTPNGSILEDRIVTAAGSYNATASLTSGVWVMQIAAFRGAGGGGGGDTTPPSVPGGVTATAISSSQINLSWTASTDNVGVTGYRVERCQGSGCTSFVQIATPTATSLSDTGLLSGTVYSYRVRATDAANNASGYSTIAVANTPTETTPPVVSITAPTAGATVTGSATLTASASDPGSGVGGVQFRVDGLNVGLPDTTSPYSISLASAQFANGTHAIDAYAWDNAGNSANATQVSVTFSNASPGNPAVTGLWSGLMSWPLVAVHVNLLRDGRVLMWDALQFGYPDPIVWDPFTGKLKVVPVNDGANVFCSGQASLPDGRVLAAGGNIANDTGLNTARIFDPATDAWSSGPNMAFGRWYPTLTKLADGRVLVLSGETTCQHCYANTPEIYNPATNSWTPLSGASNISWPFYPHPAPLSDGRILVAGTTEVPTATRALTIGTQSWVNVDARVFESGSTVMYAQDKFLKSGSSADSNGNAASTNVARVLDMTQSSPQWATANPMSFPRAYHVLTVLPDGNVLATGGGRTTRQDDVANAVLQAELWSPGGTWTTLSSMNAPRLYHGTALLMPDARVLIAGGGSGSGTPVSTDQKSGELFAPPYLFKGPRPVITAAPQLLAYGQAFDISTPNAAQITRVVLISTGNMTHAFNQNQRSVPLAFVPGTNVVTATSPANGNVAPPGFYMLFIVGSNGVPSVAAIVQL